MAEFRLTGSNFRLLMQSLLDPNSAFRVKVRGRGYSMSPFIEDNSVLILKPVYSFRGIKFGDIVAVPDHSGTKVMVHRVIGSAKGRYQLKGDNNVEADGWFPGKVIIGIVDKIERQGLFPYSGKHWQNVVIALGSKTGLLSCIFYPAYRLIRSWIR